MTKEPIISRQEYFRRNHYALLMRLFAVAAGAAFAFSIPVWEENPLSLLPCGILVLAIVAIHYNGGAAYDKYVETMNKANEKPWNN